MTEDDVKAVATKFVAEEAADHSRKHGVKPFSYVFDSARLHPRLQGQWAAVFTIRTPEGHVMDGMVVVLVDDVTGNVKFLN